MRFEQDHTTASPRAPADAPRNVSSYWTLRSDTPEIRRPIVIRSQPLRQIGPNSRRPVLREYPRAFAGRGLDWVKNRQGGTYNRA